MARKCPQTGDAVLYTECLECGAKDACRQDSIKKKEPFALLVVGSRTVTDYEFVRKKLDLLTEVAADRYEITVVSGGARGADSLGERYAKEKGYRFVCMKAEWDRYGAKAGYIRNRSMHEYISRYEHRGCVAFWDGISRGTSHSIKLAEEFHTPIRVIRSCPG